MYAELGQRFGSLTVLSEQRFRMDFTPADLRTPGKKPDAAVVAECDCGHIDVYRIKQMHSSKTCRFCSARKAREGATTELSTHYLYYTWASVKNRCTNPNSDNYPYYGGRGIELCPEWYDSASFFKWMDENLGPRPEGYTIDRIDNDGNYEPGNVRWASRKTQANNQRGRYA